MKTRKNIHKLFLNKNTVANLEAVDMTRFKGGSATTNTTTNTTIKTCITLERSICLCPTKTID